MKSEFLAIYHDEHGIPLAKRALGNIHRLNWLGSWFRPMTNFVLTSKFGKTLLGLLGLPTERPLPTLTPKRFSKTIPQTKHQHAAPDATLIVDTYTEFNHPQLGEAFLKVAGAFGKNVSIMRLPGQGCCGRPALSQGLADQVKHMAMANVSRLSQIPGQGPFLFLEPSCLSMFMDDYLVLVESDLQQQAHQLAQQCMSVEAWLVQQFDMQQPTWNSENIPSEILLHGHCHQKALYGTDDTLHLLEHLPGASVTELDAGCCGVAGGFGYEHYELSLKIANQRLLPAIAARPEAVVVAAGTSCRTQVSEADYEVWHPVEILAQAIAD
jgi:Fe-S oxidoreductase